MSNEHCKSLNSLIQDASLEQIEQREIMYGIQNIVNRLTANGKEIKLIDGTYRCGLKTHNLIFKFTISRMTEEEKRHD